MQTGSAATTTTGTAIAGPARRAGGLAPAVLGIGLLVACNTPGGTVATRAASLSAGPTVYTSELYGYSLTLPPGWVRRETVAGEWEGELFGGHGVGPGVETWDAPRGAGTFYAAAREPAEGATLDDWTAETMSFVAATCGEPATEEITLGGEPGTLLEYQECGAGQFYVLYAATVHEGRGYLLGWRGPRGNEEADRATFDEIAGSLAFGGH